VLRYIRTIHREKGAGHSGAPPTVAWPEHAEMERGDVVVTVEHCHSCHRHRMTTRHDPEVYRRHANAVKELLIESLRESPIRLAVILKRAPLRLNTSSRDGRGCSAAASSGRDRRVGAFEIQVNT
ncbi:unnamed protein product, partial [Hapterophycus canaliculatus]